jgi:hypothetical protein
VIWENISIEAFVANVAWRAAGKRVTMIRQPAQGRRRPF